MDELVVFALICRHCRSGFVVCRPDYHGQAYCNDTCRDLEQDAIHRRANAKHQRSDEGRRDHADHQRSLKARKLAEAQALTEVGRQEVAPRAEWSAPDHPAALAMSTPEVVGEADEDELHGGLDTVRDADVDGHVIP